MTFNRLELIYKLEFLAPALADKAKNSPMPVYSCFCFTGDVAYAWDNLCGLHTELKTDFSGGMEGSALLDFLKKVNSEEVEIAKEANSFVCRAGKSKATIPYLPPSSFVYTLPTVGKSPFIISKQFISALSRASKSMGEESNTPWMFGVVIESNGLLYSSNDRIMTKAASGLSGLPEIVLPPRFVKILLDNVARQTISLNENGILVKMDDGVLFSKTIESNHASTRIQERMSNYEGSKSSPLPEGLKDALKRALVSKSDFTQFKADGETLNLITEGQITIKDSLDCAHEPAAGEFNAKTVLEVLENATEFKILKNCLRLRSNSFVHLIAGKHQNPS